MCQRGVRALDTRGLPTPGLLKLVQDAAGQWEEAPALSGQDGQIWSFRELLTLVETTMAQLREGGIRRSDRVVLVAPSGAEGGLSVLATACCCVAAPLPAGLSLPALEQRMRRISPQLVILPSEGEASAADAAEACGVPLQRLMPAPHATLGLLASPPARSTPRCQAEGERVLGDGEAVDQLPALLLATSGTTGEPRLVSLTHANLSSSAQSILQVLELSPEDRCLNVMPLAHIHGLSLLLSSLAAGAQVHISASFSQESFLAGWQAVRPTWYSAAPSMHALIADWLEQRPDLLVHAPLRFVRSASGPMPGPWQERLEALLGVPLIEAYGMTEAAPQISSNRLPPEHRKRGSVGRAAGPEIAIVDSLGQPLPPGETGEVVVRGPNVMAAYLDDPEADLRSRHGSWLRTGDLGHLDADGDLFITGRLADRIERGGLAIAPEPIEAVLLSHPRISDAAVFPVPHPVLGQNVAAAVVVQGANSDGQDDDLLQELRELVSSQLAASQIPQPLLVVGQLPADPGGKRQRRHLAQALGLLARPTDCTKPLSEVERRLAALWAEVLPSTPEAGDDNFFQLGGHSLAASSLVARFQSALGLPLPLSWVFEHPSLRSQAEDLGQRLAAALLAGKAESLFGTEYEPCGPDAQALRGERGGAAPLAPAQQGFWLLQQLGQGQAYAMAMGWALSGDLDPDLLRRSLALVIERHISLRSVFRLEGDRPVQHPQEETAPFQLPLMDWSGMDEEEVAATFERRVLALRSAPFDLERGPLLRAELIKLAAGLHRLLLAVHHIVFDRWSVALLERELHATYDALAGGRPPALPPLPLSAHDAARVLAAPLSTAVARQSLENWTRRLAGAPALSTFPAARPRPRSLSGRGARLVRTMAPSQWDAVEAFAREQAATPYMVLLAALLALLQRHAGQDDLVVGSPHAQRYRPEFESLIGCFAGTVVLRSDLSGDPDFITLLQQVRTTTLQALEPLAPTVDRLLEALEIPRSLGHNPLFQVMLAFQELPNQRLSDGAADRRIRSIPIVLHDETAKFDLTLYLEGQGRQRVTRWQYSTDLYDPDDISRFADHYETLLARILAEPRQPLSQLTRLPGPERDRVVRLSAGPSRPELLTTDFMTRIEAQAARTPAATALVGKGGLLSVGCPQLEPSGAMTHSYEELNNTANRLARALQRLGFGSEDRIGVLLPRTPDPILCQLAIAKLGASFVGLDPSYPEARIRWMVADADLATVITSAEHAFLLNTPHQRLEDLADALQEESGDNLEQSRNPDSAAYLLYTSGSTGRPRGVVVNRGNLTNYGPALTAALGLTPADRWLHTASFSFSSSIRQGLVPLMAGASVVVTPTADLANPLQLWDWIREIRATVVDLVPTHWRVCHAALSTLPDNSHQSLLDATALRLMLSASEPMPATLPRQWAPLLDREIRLFNLYGQTETTGIVSLQEIEPAMAETGGLMPIGRPIANLRCHVLDAAGQPLPVGTPGELHVGGAGVGAGYWRLPTHTAERFLPDPWDRGGRLYRTGDRAVLRADGTLQHLGRQDGQVKRGGVRIEPGEIETILLEEPRIARAVVVATGGSVPETRRVVAFVEAPSCGAELHETLLLRLQQRLPSGFLPEALVIREKLPCTSNGKVDRLALAAVAAGSESMAQVKPIARRPYVAPRNARELRLATIWSQVLELPRVGIDDNFFELGGDSLRSVRVVEQAIQAGLDLDLKRHFLHQTIGSLADACWGAAEPTPLKPRSASAEPLVARSPGQASCEEVLVPIDTLRQFGQRLLEQVGLEAEGARIVTEVQLESSLRGQPTHHIDSLPRYARRLRAGTLNGRPAMRIESESGVAARLDGDNAPGQWVATVAMDQAIAKAREHGIGLVTARRSNHYGAAGQYAWMAARQGLIGFTTTNGPVILAPTGGTTATFGNNPIGVGIPAGMHPPVLLDFALTVAPRGRIAVTVANGTPLPEGWILNSQGKPSSDLADLAAGLGIPIGGHKGYGLALVMEILAGVLSGAGFGLDHGRHLLGAYAGGADFGHLFLVLDPALLLPRREFLERVDQLIIQTKQGKLASDSTEILIPGERELLTREHNLERGYVALTDLSWRMLCRYAEEAGVQGLPEPLSKVSRSAS